MKILFDHPNPFIMAHGGFQIQIQQTIAAVKDIGVEAEHLRWWDDTQRGDLVYFFGRPAPGYITAMQRKGIKVIIAPLLTGMGSRSPVVLSAQRMFTRTAKKVLPAMLTSPFGWESFIAADGCTALTPWEAHLMSFMFGAPPEKVHIVPNGVEEVFLNARPEKRGSWLVCTATVTDRKRVLELAQAAVTANTPVWIIGKPYSETDPYAQRFLALQSKHREVIRYEGAVQDRAILAQVYCQARGFVLLSERESLSLSALEAAACRCPLLLSDLPWARIQFKENAVYCPITSTNKTAAVLRNFYDVAPQLPPPPKPLSWHEVAGQLKTMCERVLAQSR